MSPEDPLGQAARQLPSPQTTGLVKNKKIDPFQSPTHDSDCLLCTCLGREREEATVEDSLIRSFPHLANIDRISAASRRALGWAYRVNSQAWPLSWELKSCYIFHLSSTIP